MFRDQREAVSAAPKKVPSHGLLYFLLILLKNQRCVFVNLTFKANKYYNQNIKKRLVMTNHKVAVNKLNLFWNHPKMTSQVQPKTNQH